METRTSSFALHLFKECEKVWAGPWTLKRRAHERGHATFHQQLLTNVYTTGKPVQAGTENPRTIAVGSHNQPGNHSVLSATSVIGLSRRVPQAAHRVASTFRA